MATSKGYRMDFNWRSPVVPRIAFLAGSIFLFSYFATHSEWAYAIVFFLLSAYQLKLLIDNLDRSYENIASFLDSIST